MGHCDARKVRKQVSRDVKTDNKLENDEKRNDTYQILRGGSDPQDQ